MKKQDNANNTAKNDPTMEELKISHENIPSTYPDLDALERAKRNVMLCRLCARTPSYIADLYATLDDLLYTDINIKIEDKLYQPIRIILGAYCTYLIEMRPLEDQCITSLAMMAQMFTADISKMMVSDDDDVFRSYSVLSPGITSFSIGKLYQKLVAPGSPLSLLGRGFWQAMYTMDMDILLQANNIIFTQLGIYYQAANFEVTDCPQEDGTHRREYAMQSIPIMYAIELGHRSSVLTSSNLFNVRSQRPTKRPIPASRDDLIDLDKVLEEKQTPLRARKIRNAQELKDMLNGPDANKDEQTSLADKANISVSVHEDADYITFEVNPEEKSDEKPVHT